MHCPGKYCRVQDKEFNFFESNYYIVFGKEGGGILVDIREKKNMFEVMLTHNCTYRWYVRYLIVISLILLKFPTEVTS